MKKIIFPVLFTGIFGAGCDYVDVPTPAAPQVPVVSSGNHRKVLVEEVTGQRCPTCPAGALALAAAKSVYADSMIIIAVHTGYFAQTPPGIPVSAAITNIDPLAFFLDLNCDEAEDLDLTFQLSGAPPISMVNRLGFLDELYRIPPSNVATVLDTVLNRPQSASFAITHTYDVATRQLSFGINGNYLTQNGQSGDNFFLVALITEDSILGWQDYQGAQPLGAVQNYVFNHVLRASVNTPGSVAGTLLGSAPALAGDTIQYTLPAPFTLSNSFNAAHCNLVVYIYNGTTKEVLQAEEVHL
ncbi:MAG: Omp28-related outer membrane protein [Bacteroidetes bacterium]|nr:Omp28-related outer membrane protein [Bacteroidota bacterium]